MPALSQPFRVAPALSAGAPRHPRAERSVLLINPFYRKDARASLGKHVLTPTLALSSLAGVTPPDWSVRIWDENLLQGPPPADPPPRVAGITVHLTFAKRAYELARWLRSRGTIVIFGGPHVSACTDEAAAHADAVVLGNGVAIWPTVLADIAAGRLRRRYDGAWDELAAAPPRRDLLPQASYLTTASLNATNGCRNRCDFCYLSTAGVRMPWRVRDPRDVAAEFAATGEPYGVFTDNNLGSDPDHLIDLCAALRPLQRIWSAAVTLDVTDREDAVAAMAAAGCTGVFIGFESLGDGNLRRAGKRTPPAEEYARRVRMFHRHGIQVNASFVFGFDGDDTSIFARTVAWCEAVRLECATFHILTPYPGTPLFRRMDAAGRILTRDWQRYDTAHCVFRPARMTPQELEAGYAWCYRRMFSFASILRRRPEDPRAVLPYLAMALLYKRSNPLWSLLIRHRLVHAVWHPLVELTRRRVWAKRSRRPELNLLAVPAGV